MTTSIMIIMDRKFIAHQKLINSLALREGSPCLKCLVRPTCTKSVVAKSACMDYVKFLQKLVERAKNESKA